MTEEINWSAPNPNDAPQDFAKFWIRLLAHICDQICSLVVAAPLAILLALLSIDQVISVVTVGLASALLIAYWTHKRGGSPLRVQLGVLVVTKANGNFLSFDRALLRGLIPAVLTMTGNFIWIFLAVALINYASFFWDKNSQTWHDKAAGSVVVKR